MARTEISRADALSALRRLKPNAGAAIESVESVGKPSVLCHVDRKWVARIDKPILNLNEIIIGRDGGIFINNFAQNDGYDTPEQTLHQYHRQHIERRATNHRH